MKLANTQQAGQIIVKGCTGGCGRDFLAVKGRCQEHCSPNCCRATACELAKPKQPSSTRPCKVCYRPRSMFERFAACDSHCSRYFFHSTKEGRQNPWDLDWARSWICEKHTPAGKPRVHIDYCSLRCYNSRERGHEATVRAARRRYYRRNAEHLRAYLNHLRESHPRPSRHG